MENELKVLASQLHMVFQKHRVLRTLVFGSFRRGEVTRRSDLDLIVVKDTQEPFLDRYEGVLQDIAQAVPGRDVDVLIYTPQELVQMAHRPFIATALAEGKVIYESEQRLSDD
jgi:predicted nucleotidyltransferase